GHDPRRHGRQPAQTKHPSMIFKTDSYAEVRKRTAEADRATLNQIIRPRLGSKKVAEVAHTDIEALHRKLRATPYRANRVVALLSKMFALSVKWGMRPDNPARGIERYQEHRRERYLRPDEIARLGAALDAHPNQQSANAVRLLLLTGARRGEVLGARWSDIDLEAGVWTKPGATTKQKTIHRVPLSEAAVSLLKGIKAGDEAKAQRAREAGKFYQHSRFVFPGKGPDEHLGEIKHFWASICETAKIEGARIHDLRHTYASLLASEGSSLPIIGQLLVARFDQLARALIL
ncbi:MAG: tyrosine-type recombinase/integrase, partial [Stellaceae bacterium]